MDEQSTPADVESSPLLGGSPERRRRSRWQAAAAAAAATLGVVALARGGRTDVAPSANAAAAPATKNALYDKSWQVPTTDNTDLVQPPKGAKPLEMGHFGKWTIMASTKAHMDETAEAMWWGYNMMERFRDYSVDPAFPSYSYLGPTGCSTVKGGGSPRDISRPDDEVHVVWNSGNQIQNKATIDGRTLSLSAEEVFESIRTLHVQTALQDNQFSGQRLGWFDVTGIERAVWGARDNWEKFGWPYRLLKGIAVVQDQNYSPHKEIELYIVRSLTRDGKLLEITAVANNAKDTQEAFMNVKTDPTLRYPAKLPAWTFGVTACGSDVPYIFCGVPRFNRRLFEIQTSEPESGLDSPLLEAWMAW